MNKLVAVLTGCFVLALATPSHAEDELAPGYNECNDRAESMVDNIECAASAVVHWDRILNANYKKAQEACEGVEKPEQCKKDLLKAQRLWIQYKEVMAEVITNLEGGGSLARLSANTFVARETRKQAELLASGE